jgi:hypothetical protein
MGSPVVTSRSVATTGVVVDSDAHIEGCGTLYPEQVSHLSLTRLFTVYVILLMLILCPSIMCLVPTCPSTMLLIIPDLSAPDTSL